MARRTVSKPKRQLSSKPAAEVSGDPIARLLNCMPDADRRHLEFMDKVGAIYVESFRDDQLAAEMEKLIENAAGRRDPSKPHGPKNRLEGVGFAVLAESRAGKTTAIEHLIRTTPAFRDFGERSCMLVSVTAPAPCTLQKLGTQILRTVEYKLERELRENEAWPVARDQLELQNKLFLHIGEIQRVLHVKGKDDKKVVETLVGLMTDGAWPPLQVIFSGLPDMIPVFDNQKQLSGRTRWVPLHPVDPARDFNDLARGMRLYEKVGLSLKQVGDRETVARICHAANYRWGLFWEILRGGIDFCARSGRRSVTLKDLSNSFAGRTTEPLRLNPFYISDWRSIDPTLIRFKDDEAEEKGDGKQEMTRLGDD